MKNIDSRTQVESTIAFKRKCVEKCDKAAEIIRKMDGKVLNVTLQRALNAGEEYPAFFSVDLGTSVDITYKALGGQLWMIRVPREKRIDASVYLEDLEKTRSRLLEDIADLELTMSVIDERIEQIKKAVAALNALTTTLPYAVQEAYDIPRKIYF